jgi:parallel beta-helix repeat protein
MSILTLAINVQPVKASGTIYIRADGSVDPPTAPITTVDNVTYAFTYNIYDSIVVERDNITIDGNGYTLQGSGSGEGVVLNKSNNVTIRDMSIKAFDCAIHVEASSNIIISRNNLTNNMAGINVNGSNYNIISENSITAAYIYGIGILYSLNNIIFNNSIVNNGFVGVALALGSQYNNISENDIARNEYGIELLLDSHNNIVFGNNLARNQYATSFLASSNNVIHHNDFVKNDAQIDISLYSYNNIWDDGYPSGGNYWSDYTGIDADSDGIGDTPYIIDESNIDRYPLMNPYGAPPTFYLTITSTGGGTTDPVVGTYEFAYDSTVNVTATPNANYILDYWELDGSYVESVNPIQILMDDDHTLNAVFLLSIGATLYIQPQALNLEGIGKWVSAYIEFPEGYNITDIDYSSVMLNDTVLADTEAPATVGDYDSDCVPDLMVKFNRTTIIDFVLAKGMMLGNVTLALGGKLYDETQFRGSAIIKVSALAADVNCDGKVDISDIVQAAASYGSKEGDPNWNANANLAQSYGVIDILDLVTITAHYGEKYP